MTTDKNDPLTDSQDRLDHSERRVAPDPQSHTQLTEQEIAEAFAPCGSQAIGISLRDNDVTGPVDADRHQGHPVGHPGAGHPGGHPHGHPHHHTSGHPTSHP